MKVDGKAYRTIWPAEDRRAVEIIDQTRLPHAFATARLETLEDVVDAISHMLVRGAPLIGAAAAYGVCLALHQDASDACLARARQALLATRPTAVNLPWALEEMRAAVELLPLEQRPAAAYKRAAAICDEDVAINESVGEHGLGLIRNLWESKGKPSRLNILTHCNAGWLATVDWGTALAPVYKARDAGVPVHVWVDETRPRNQGASLTAWELNHQRVPHTVIVDNAGGHLMQHGLVDICIVGTDRTTATGDVCNKIGTYLKALAARENGVPFYAAVPSPSIDWDLDDGLAQIPIEQRDADEVARVTGRTHSGEVVDVTIIPDGSPVANYAFDVTPARYITGLITERGICSASREGLEGLFGQGVGVK